MLNTPPDHPGNEPPTHPGFQRDDPSRAATAARPHPRCTVGLLTWNGGAETLACIQSVLDQSEQPLNLLWIDNASTDGTVAMLRDRFPDLRPLHVNPRNLGFCAGHNQLLAACRTPYYLALNQDIVLAPDYIEKLCDWLDQTPELALVSGLILWPSAPGGASGAPDAPERIYSAGLVFPRVRFPFELAMDQPLTEHWRRRRIVPGVTGAAMLLRVAACHRASLPAGEVFPNFFFAYGEEVDLALRLARAGARCGVEGTALAWHSAESSGGRRRRAIAARAFRNHWLLTLRHESFGAILRELPWITRGVVSYWLPRWLRQPAAFALALAELAAAWGPARRFYRVSERAWGPTAPRLAEYKKISLKELRLSREPGPAARQE